MIIFLHVFISGQEEGIIVYKNRVELSIFT